MHGPMNIKRRIYTTVQNVNYVNSRIWIEFVDGVL
jgi:hypothetical protein